MAINVHMIFKSVKRIVSEKERKKQLKFERTIPTAPVLVMSTSAVMKMII